MVTLIINVAVLVWFAVVAAELLLASRHNGSGRPGQMSRRQFMVLLLGGGLLLVKFVLLGDNVLIIGQAALVAAAFVYSLQAFFMPTSDTTLKSEPSNEETAAGQRPPRHRKPHSRRRKLAIAGGLSLLAVVVVAVGLVRSFNTASQGTVDTPQAPHNAPAPQAVHFTGKRFSFNYSDNFSPSHTDPPSPPILENYIFVKHQVLAWQLSIQIESLPSGNLNDAGSYHFRSVTPDRFTDDPTSVNGTMVHVFTDKNSGFNFSKVLYLQHQGLLASLALHGGAPNDTDAMQAALLSIASSWQWR